MRTQRRLPRIYMLFGFAATFLTLAVVVRLYYELLLAPASTTESPAIRSKLRDPPALNFIAETESKEQHNRELRTAMVAQQIESRGVNDRQVLDAMRRVPRHLFVPKSLRRSAYADRPLPIGLGQTISQPLIVAEMTQLSRPTPTAIALDVGTGSGYQAAILAELVDQVYSIEILKPLADEARTLLQSLGYQNVEVRHGDGYRGWPEQAPFDLIIVAAAPDHVPEPLIEQLKPGGRLVIPVGARFFQRLVVIEKQLDGTIVRHYVESVSFVPMTGEAESKSDR
jgi:protein-L-isoaspartate(D-aspartate) O-methyltransferase